MLWTLFVILMALWLVGVVSAYTLHGYLHVLLAVALGLVVLRAWSGRRVV